MDQVCPHRRGHCTGNRTTALLGRGQGRSVEILERMVSGRKWICGDASLAQSSDHSEHLVECQPSRCNYWEPCCIVCSKEWMDVGAQHTFELVMRGLGQTEDIRPTSYMPQQRLYRKLHVMIMPLFPSSQIVDVCRR